MENRVLVVDDNEFMLSLICQILDDQGYEVKTLTRAKGLIEHIQKYHPNLIILDVELPDGDGRELCNQIKLSDETHAIPVVMCSGMDDLGDYFKKIKPDGILPKPFDMSRLIELVEEKLPLAA
ncbi:response regulator [Mucilaginibacter sp. PAMB04274]|uniref:response regulator n=1 Tax=Mucilaginibacter sp. PAMB04274 TaxID=3138568 RepID=UPI0031F6EEC1